MLTSVASLRQTRSWKAFSGVFSERTLIQMEGKKTLWGRYLVEIFDPVQTEGRRDFIGLYLERQKPREAGSLLKCQSGGRSSSCWC